MVKFLAILHCALALEKGKLTVATKRAVKRQTDDENIAGWYKYKRTAPNDLVCQSFAKC